MNTHSKIYIMLEKLKTAPLTNLIIIGLLCYILFTSMFQSTHVEKTDTSADKKQIENIAKELKSIKEMNVQSNQKIDNLGKIVMKTSTNINYIQTQLKDEKSSINFMSDDENVKYFHNYIDKYNSSKSND